MNNQLLSRAQNIPRSFQLFARLLQINAFARANWCVKPLSPSACVPTLPLAREPWSTRLVTSLVVPWRGGAPIENGDPVTPIIYERVRPLGAGARILNPCPKATG